MNIPENFGKLVFDDRVMKAVLTAKEYDSLKKTMDEVLYDFKDGQNILTLKKTI